MTQQKYQRKKIWIDRFQTYLSMRMALYFVVYQIAVWSLAVLERGIFISLRDLVGREVTTSVFLFLASTAVFLGLLFIYDAVVFVHRVVGPLYRFRKVIQAITAGEEVEVIRLRKGDFLQELKDDLNEMLKALEQRGAVTLKVPPQQQEAQKQQDQPVAV